MTYPASVLCDFYKVSHREQYPKGTQRVYSTWIPRASRIEGIDRVVAFGFQAFIQKYLVDYFDQHFFDRPKDAVLNEYIRLIKHTLGDPNPDASHLEHLWELGYLPLEIKAVPEGTVVPLRVPMLTVENTVDEAFWLTNYIETLFSCEVWQPSTTATIAREYRKILDHWASLTGGDKGFVPFQGHDFSMRGMEGVDAAAASGAGHLLSFVGTDTIPAIHYLERFYGADIENDLVGTSIPATEHSVMCAGGRSNEYDTYKRLITEVYPTGLLSVVSDTWDLWTIVGAAGVLDNLKDKIMARDGKVVIRPDSGDPVDIITGNNKAVPGTAAFKGVIECLWDIFGGTYTSTGHKLLDSHIGCIYGDAITLDRVQQICERLFEKGFASTNMVYGIGSYTYQYQTRDTFSFALKSTWVRINDQGIPIFKDPITDTGTKKSLTGRVAVLPQGAHGGDRPVAVDGLDKAGQEIHGGRDLLQPIFRDGQVLRTETLEEIRTRLQRQV